MLFYHSSADALVLCCRIKGTFPVGSQRFRWDGSGRKFPRKFRIKNTCAMNKGRQRNKTERFLFHFLPLKNFVRLFSLTKAESYTFHHCRRRRLRSLFTLECRGYSNYQVIKLLKHLYRICVVTTKVRVPPQQHQISSQFSKELTETKLREEKFSIHVRFRVSDDGIEWLMMLQEKRRKLRCDVKVIKAEEWRTNKSTFEIENVEEKNLHTKFLMNKARDGCRKMCFDDDGK